MVMSARAESAAIEGMREKPHPSIEKILAGACMALVAVGLAAPANATSHAPAPNSAQSFLAAVHAAGIVGVDPAMLENGYNVCWEIWNGHYTGARAAAGMQQNYPTLTASQAKRFVVAAYKNLCPVPGAYDWWAYSTS